MKPRAWLVLAAAVALPAAAADVVNGGRVYTSHCAACHGANGVAVMPDAPNFSRAERLMQPDMTLLMSIKNGNRAMPAYNGILRDREILDVVAYLRTLQR